MKHLKLRIELLPDNEHVTVKVLRQTHKGNSFGRPRRSFNHTTDGVEVSLVSDVLAHVNGVVQSMYVLATTNHLQLYVNGTHPEDKLVAGIVPIGYYNALKAAVIAYNEHFK